MKSLLLTYLILISPMVFSAGVTIELESSVSIGTIVYTDSYEYIELGGPSVAEFNVENRDKSDGISSAIIRSLMLPEGDISWTEWAADLGALVASYYTSDDEVAVAVMDVIHTELQPSNHETLSAANVEYILGPNLRSYALDPVNDHVWGRGVWDEDSQLLTWQELAVVQDIPEGDLERFLLETGDQLYLSIDTGVEKGIWKIADVNSTLVSDALNSEANLIISIGSRAIQFIPFRSGAGFIGRILDEQPEQDFNDYTFSDIPVEKVDSVQGLVDTEGEMYVFNGVGFQNIQWLIDGDVQQVTYPKNVTSFDECFATNGRILCMNQGVFENSLYEWSEGRFKLDVSWPHFWLDYEDAGEEVYSVVDIEAAAENRYVLYSSGQKLLLMDHSNGTPLKISEYTSLGNAIETSHLEIRGGSMLWSIEDEDRMHAISFELAEETGFISLASNSEDLSNAIDGYGLYGFVAGETGALSIHKYIDEGNRSEGIEEYLFRWSGNDGEYLIEAPYRTSDFKGCFESSPELFCVFKTTDDFVVLFELKDGVFRADTKIGNSLTMKTAEILFIKAYGDKRYGLINTNADSSNEYMAFMADPLASYQLTASDCNVGEGTYASNRHGEIRLISCLGDQIDFNNIEYDPDMEYVQNTFNGADMYVYLESRDGEQENVIPRSEIAGYFSLGILGFMLLLLSLRKPNSIRL